MINVRRCGGLPQGLSPGRRTDAGRLYPGGAGAAGPISAPDVAYFFQTLRMQLRLDRRAVGVVQAAGQQLHLVK